MQTQSREELLGSLHSRDSRRHGYLTSLHDTNANTGGRLAVCLYFTAQERSIGDRSDFILFGWPIRRAAALSAPADVPTTHSLVSTFLSLRYSQSAFATPAPYAPLAPPPLRTRQSYF